MLRGSTKLESQLPATKQSASASTTACRCRFVYHELTVRCNKHQLQLHRTIPSSSLPACRLPPVVRIRAALEVMADVRGQRLTLLLSAKVMHEANRCWKSVAFPWKIGTFPRTIPAFPRKISTFPLHKLAYLQFGRRKGRSTAAFQVTVNGKARLAAFA